MPADNEAAVAAAVDVVRRYLDAHPHAADSVEGIARWWLTRQRFGETVPIVTQALEYLVNTGEVTKIRKADGRFLYCRGTRRR